MPVTLAVAARLLVQEPLLSRSTLMTNGNPAQFVPVQSASNVSRYSVADPVNDDFIKAFAPMFCVGFVAVVFVGVIASQSQVLTPVVQTAFATFQHTFDADALVVCHQMWIWNVVFASGFTIPIRVNACVPVCVQSIVV